MGFLPDVTSNERKFGAAAKPLLIDSPAVPFIVQPGGAGVQSGIDAIAIRQPTTNDARTTIYDDAIGPTSDANSAINDTTTAASNGANSATNDAATAASNGANSTTNDATTATGHAAAMGRAITTANWQSDAKLSTTANSTTNVPNAD
jgi:hypothetical protein